MATLTNTADNELAILSRLIRPDRRDLSVAAARHPQDRFRARRRPAYERACRESPAWVSDAAGEGRDRQLRAGRSPAGPDACQGPPILEPEKPRPVAARREVTRHGTAAWTWLHAPREDKGLEFWRNRMLTLLPSAGGAEAVDSFPRSAWECRLRRSASFPIAGSPVGCDRHQRLGLRRIPHSFPRRAWERVSERRK